MLSFYDTTPAVSELFQIPAGPQTPSVKFRSNKTNCYLDLEKPCEFALTRASTRFSIMAPPPNRDLIQIRVSWSQFESNSLRIGKRATGDGLNVAKVCLVPDLED